jgi:hypothetical protein
LNDKIKNYKNFDKMTKKKTNKISKEEGPNFKKIYYY